MQNMSKYTFWSVISEWGNLLPQIIRQWRTFLLYGALITILSGAFGRWSFSCQEGNTGPWCYVPTDNFTTMVIFLIVFFILVCLLVALFIFDFQQNVNQNSVFKLKDACLISKPKIKSVLFIYGIFLGFILPVLIAMAIINKPANPDYRIEFCFFTIMFIMFMIPLLQIRLSAGIAYFLNQGYVPFRKIFNITLGKSFIPLLLFFMLIVLMLSIHLRSMGYFSYITRQHNLFIVVLLTDFADNVLKLGCLSLFLLFFQAQYTVMEKITNTQQDEEEKPAMEVLKGEVATEQFSTAKAAHKKKNKRKAQNAKVNHKKEKSDE